MAAIWGGSWCPVALAGSQCTNIKLKMFGLGGGKLRRGCRHGVKYDGGAKKVANVALGSSGGKSGYRWSCSSCYPEKYQPLKRERRKSELMMMVVVVEVAVVVDAYEEGSKEAQGQEEERRRRKDFVGGIRQHPKAFTRARRVTSGSRQVPR